MAFVVVWSSDVNFKLYNNMHQFMYATCTRVPRMSSSLVINTSLLPSPMVAEPSGVYLAVIQSLIPPISTWVAADMRYERQGSQAV
jgi:hypothetical protein